MLRAAASLLLAGLALAACAENAAQREERRAFILPDPTRPPYQRRFAPIYPSERTPGLVALGDIDTPRSYLGQSWRHRGFDIAGRAGDPVIAVAPGEVCYAREEIGGIVAVLRPQRRPGLWEDEALLFVHDKGETAVRISYQHLQGFAGAFGECRFVELGAPIGAIGNSGIASTPHLHFEVVAEDTRDFPGIPALGGAINPLYVMRREPGDPIGTVTCHEPGMTYRPNAGKPERALAIVWPTPC